MGFCKSDQKSIPVVGFLTCNDCDVLRAKTGLYKRVTTRTIILPTASNHPALHRVHNQISTTQGCCEGLYHAYKALVPSHLLLRHHKPMLTKLEVGPPQLIGLTSDFDALTQNGHLWTHSSDHWLLIFIRSWCTQMHPAPLATVTGRTRVTACGLIAWEPYKGSSKNKIKIKK